MHFLTPALLDFTANGHVQERLGNQDLNFAPHGVYAVQGEDRYIAIACETDNQWRALCQELFRNDNQRLQSAQNQTARERLQQADALDTQIETFTALRDGAELEDRLQALGIPASLVQNSPELLDDPQLNHLGHYIELPHHEGGTTTIEASRIHLSRSPKFVDESAPTFGRDMMFVLKDILAYDDDQIGELLVSGVLE